MIWDTSNHTITASSTKLCWIITNYLTSMSKSVNFACDVILNQLFKTLKYFITPQIFFFALKAFTNKDFE